MATYNGDKKIKIVIFQSVDPAYDYQIWEAKEGGKCIERNADEEDIQYILNPDQYEKFKQGKFSFPVRQHPLTNLFSYLA